MIYEILEITQLMLCPLVQEEIKWKDENDSSVEHSSGCVRRGLDYLI